MNRDLEALILAYEKVSASRDIEAQKPCKTLKS